MQPKANWLEMFPDEFVARRDARPVCYIAYGLAEPHGAYNALGLDELKAQGLIEATVREYGGIAAPPSGWHIQEIPEFHDDGHGHGWLVDVGVQRSLATALPPDLFYRMVLHQIRAIDAAGFHAAVLVTGHYGGLEIVLRRLCDYYTRRSGSPLRLRAIADNEAIDTHLPLRGDHAGPCETSQLMALRPELVDLERRTVPAELGTHFAAGVNFDTGRQPDAAIGQEIVASQIRNLGAMGQELLAEFSPRENWRVPNQHDVDAIWDRFDRLTRRYWTFTYQEYKEGKAFKFPTWEELAD